MPEQRSPLKEYRHLAEKLATVGLSNAEQARFQQLRAIVSPEAAPPKPGFDVNAAADALRASLEPAGLRRGPAPAAQPGSAADPGASAWDPNQPYGPGAQDGYDAPPPDAAYGTPTGIDPGSGALNQGPLEPGSGAPAWDPNQPYDPNAPGGDASSQAGAPGASAGLDPGSGALNQGPLEPGSGAPAWDPNAPGSYDQAAWDTGAALPPVDPAAAFDLNAPSFEAAVPGEDQAGSWGAGAQGPEPAVRPYDLGPEAFDAAALPPPETGAAGYDQAGWDAVPAGAAPEPAAGTPPEEVVEAELVEAELIEVEPVPEAPAPGPDLFTPGPLTPDVTGAQPLDAGFEPAEAGGPGGAEASPAGIDLRAEGAGDAAEAVPLESPSEFLSTLQPEAPPVEVPPVGTLEGGEVAIEELPPVEVEVEEAPDHEPPPPAPPAAARPAAPLPRRDAVAPPPAADFGGQSASFVTGEHRVVVHTLEGQVLRGSIADVDLDAAEIPLVPAQGAAPEPIAASRVKAIFFMLLPGSRPPVPEGKKVRVTFRDGRQVAGFSADYAPEAAGFFMVPADSRTNTGRIWVYRAAVRQVSVT